MAKSPRKPLMAANWKMNLNHLEAIAHVQKLAWSLDDKHYDAVDVVLLPPFTDIRSVQALVMGDDLLLQYGAQDLSPHDAGAYTGDVSGAMLTKLGCGYVVVGHSERREYHDETDELVNAKVKAAVKHELTPIVCVGERLEVREAGDAVPHTLAQVDAALSGVPADAAKTIVIAYEPVWAIGTGKACSPEDAQQVCAAIRTRLAELYSGDAAEQVRVLYGGSVKLDNVKAIMRQADIDGGLVGGASLDPETFARLVRYEEIPV
ncbi:MAG: triose-phosphate isomerase [Streptosporangiales bacterium]|nr:triose-phosphate isomerase [Streptosporangiales bacterium]MBO0891397.1 triose-phosphate isomerase [Acidothermales bacterium]